MRPDVLLHLGLVGAMRAAKRPRVRAVLVVEMFFYVAAVLARVGAVGAAVEAELLVGERRHPVTAQRNWKKEKQTVRHQ